MRNESKLQITPTQEHWLELQPMRIDRSEVYLHLSWVVAMAIGLIVIVGG